MRPLAWFLAAMLAPVHVKSFSMARLASTGIMRRGLQIMNMKGGKVISNCFNFETTNMTHKC